MKAADSIVPTQSRRDSLILDGTPGLSVGGGGGSGINSFLSYSSEDRNCLPRASLVQLWLCCQVIAKFGSVLLECCLAEIYPIQVPELMC
jgi:hypothetical protein